MKVDHNFRIHKQLLEDFKYALVWGHSVKHLPQKVRSIGVVESGILVRLGRTIYYAMKTLYRSSKNNSRSLNFFSLFCSPTNTLSGALALRTFSRCRCWIPIWIQFLGWYGTVWPKPWSSRDLPVRTLEDAMDSSSRLWGTKLIVGSKKRALMRNTLFRENGPYENPVKRFVRWGAAHFH